MRSRAGSIHAKLAAVTSCDVSDPGTTFPFIPEQACVVIDGVCAGDQTRKSLSTFVASK